MFLDQFVDQATLLDFISMCDVYVTPYLNEAQMTSGTLAYSFGLGKAVVSTPYWHARELLADGRGVLVAIRRPDGDRQRNRGIAHRRRAPAGDARARLCGQPVDDMGANRRALPDRVRKRPTRASAEGDCARRTGRDRPARQPACRTCRSGISCPCATIPACSSTRSIRCPIAPTAIASTTMPARCCWLARSTSRARSRFRKARPHALPPSCSMPGIPIPGGSATS